MKIKINTIQVTEICTVGVSLRSISPKELETALSERHPGWTIAYYWPEPLIGKNVISFTRMINKLPEDYPYEMRGPMSAEEAILRCESQEIMKQKVPRKRFQ